MWLFCRYVMYLYMEGGTEDERNIKKTHDQKDRAINEKIHTNQQNLRVNLCNQHCRMRHSRFYRITLTRTQNRTVVVEKSGSLLYPAKVQMGHR